MGKLRAHRRFPVPVKDPRWARSWVGPTLPFGHKCRSLQWGKLLATGNCQSVQIACGIRLWLPNLKRPFPLPNISPVFGRLTEPLMSVTTCHFAFRRCRKSAGFAEWDSLDVLCISRRSTRNGYEFQWPAHSDSTYFIKPDGSTVHMAIENYVSFLSVDPNDRHAVMCVLRFRCMTRALSPGC